MVKREARERTLVALYQMDVIDAEPMDALMKRYEYDDVKPLNLSIELVKGIMENLKFIDESIKKYSKEWDIGRFSNIDRNILRIAIYEIHFMEKIPFKVSINEAVELAKLYSTEEAYKFINGILAQVIKELEN